MAITPNFVTLPDSQADVFGTINPQGSASNPAGNLLTNNLAAAGTFWIMDTTGFNSVVVQMSGTFGSPPSVDFATSNDLLNWATCAGMPVQSSGIGVPAQQMVNEGMFVFAPMGRFFRASTTSSSFSAVLTAVGRQAPIPALLGKVLITPDVTATANVITQARYVSAAAVLSQTMKSSGGSRLWYLSAANNGASKAFLKLYGNLSGATPNAAVDVPLDTIILPPGQSTFLPINDYGMAFTNALAFLVSGGIADTDATALAAGQVYVTVGYA